MPLTPLDIHNKEFTRGFRGYREEEVDQFLDEVVREFESLLKENSALRERLEALSSKVEQYRQLEDTLHNTLIIAQETAEEVKASARKEAELIMREAEEEAQDIQRRARRRVEQLSETFEELKKQMRLFRARVKSDLAGQLELLDQQIRDEVDSRSLEELLAAQAAAAAEAEAPKPSMDDTIHVEE